MPPIRTAAAFLLLSMTGAPAQDVARADFSGTWTMDARRSESSHQDVPIGPVTLVIAQNASEISIETTRKEAKASPLFHEILRYRLDGTELAMTGEGGAKVTTKARWAGSKLVTETTRNVQDSTVTTLYVQSLAPGGREMTIEKSLTVQHGYQFEGSKTTGRGTDIFVKAAR